MNVPADGYQGGRSAAQGNNRSEIDPGSRRLARGGPGICEQFRSEGEDLGNLALDLPAEPPIIPVAGTGIDPVSAPAVGCPWTPAFLDPDRQKDLDPSASQAAAARARGKFDMGERPYLGPAFGFLEKTVLQADFRIPQTISKLPTPGLIEACRSDDVEHGVGRNSIIDFKVGSRAGIVEPALHLRRGYIKLPMAEIDRFGIVGEKRRPGKDRGRENEKNRGGSEKSSRNRSSALPDPHWADGLPVHRAFRIEGSLHEIRVFPESDRSQEREGGRREPPEEGIELPRYVRRTGF